MARPTGDRTPLPSTPLSTSAGASRFATIRPWRGSQDRAFEELAYQLLKDEAPPGNVAIRTGNPDGGVEWYADLPNDGQWGWQAKNIADIDDLLRAMTESVEAVVAERSNLVRLTFVISTNLSAGTLKGKRKSQRQKYEDKVATWKREIEGADRITFELIQESDLLAKLSLPQHRGREWFWWHSPWLGPEWLEDLQQRQADVAGDKYRPDLQVDLPIAEDLSGLGLSQTMADEYEALRNRVIDTLRYQRKADTPFANLNTAIQRMVDAITPVAASVRRVDPLSLAISSFDALEQNIEACLEAIQSVRDIGSQALDLVKGGHYHENADKKEKEELLNYLDYHCRQLNRSLSELQDWLRSSSTRALRSRLYFLVGPAGSGKTHLLLDGVRSALDEGRPAAVLHGAQFRGALWADICDQLGLPPLGAEVLLGAMDAAAEAAEPDGRHFVLSIDALNETPVPGYWDTNLPALKSALMQWPHLALAASCRDTYLEVIDPSKHREKFVLETHPGFAGREIEATQKYFHHYGLEAPRIPLLTPEFTVPLFLRLYCESLRDGGKTEAAIGHEGRVEIFERYLDAKVARVAQRSFSQASGNLEVEQNQKRIRRALDTLLDAMAQANSEWIEVDRATEIVAASLTGTNVPAIGVVSAFENEGVLSQEPSYLRGEGNTVAVRVTFQAFSDFLLFKRHLSWVAAPLEDEEFKMWLHHEASWGILEAATIVLPELYGVEVPDFLGISASDLEWDYEDFQRVYRNRHVFASLASTLPYRTSASITQRTIELLNTGLRSREINVDLYKILYMLAPQPDNPLNAVGLHHHLSKQAMPRRDSWYGFAVYSEIWEETSSITRLARWAALGPYPTYPSEVIDLAATALAWLLSSPNRFMRDWVTKALVQLLHGHLGVMQRVFERFWDVNDPYVVQRVTVIAYGCLMRGGGSDRLNAEQLSRSVLDRVFARPMRADELMLDAGRGIVEWGVDNAVLPAAALDATKRPYGLKVPSNPPSKEKLEAKYELGYPRKVSESESYGAIWSSLFVMDDFGRYVVESGMHHFSRYRHGQAKPKRETQEPRLIKTRWKKFIRSLTPSQVAEWERWQSQDSPAPALAEWLFEESSPDRLTEEQWKLYRAAWTPRRVTGVDDRYSDDTARRWIFQRTISLGWKPRLFGERDWIIARTDHGRSEHKAERWGKKYQWMAYHELLARVADNFQTSGYLWDDGPYDGLQQLISRRDIDPSLPPIDYQALTEKRGDSTPSWPASRLILSPALALPLEFGRYHGDIDRFIDDRNVYPTAESTARAIDEGGDEWVALHGYADQTEKNEVGSNGLNQLLWLSSALVPQKSASRDVNQMIAIWRERPYEFGNHGHIDCCYAGEIGWSRRNCSNRVAQPRSIEFGNQLTTVIDTVERYTWEGNILDCSIGEAVWATMPSFYVRSRDHLRMIAEGPGWLDENGEIVATYMQSVEGQWSGKFWQGYFVRQSWLQRFLGREGLALAVLSKCERRLLDQDRTRTHKYVEVWSGALLRSGGLLRATGGIIREQGPPEENLE